jgi:hypothetical protein
MKGNIVEKLTTTILVLAIAVNAFMLVNIWLPTNTNVALRENKPSYILPDGFAPGKTKISWNDSLPTPSGWVVRYASKRCVYCLQDSEWERLALQLERLNYRTIVLLPKEADQFDEGEIIHQTVRQMAFVNMDWIKQFRFTMTPTVVVFDNNGRVLWHRTGMLQEADYKLAEKAITKNAKR